MEQKAWFKNALKKAPKKWLILAIAVVLTVSFISGRAVRSNRIKTRFASSLIEALSLDELSTSELVYNGIATVNHQDSDKPHYFILYNSVLKVGIQMDDINFEVNPAEKSVNILLPEVKILEVVIDPNSIDFIPDSFSADLKTAIVDSKNDAIAKSSDTPELMRTAKENLRSIIEALTLPLIQSEGYKITWNETNGDV